MGGGHLPPAMTDSAASTAPRLRPGLLISLGFGLALTVGSIGFLNWGAGKPQPVPAVPTPGPAASVQRGNGERTRLEVEHAERLAALKAQFDARIAEAADAATSAGAAERATLQDEYEAQLAHEREVSAAQMATLQAAYEEELMEARAAEPAAPAAREPGLAAATPAAEPSGAYVCSAEVALALGPFLEPGYAQLDNSFGEVALPFSYAELRATGALEPTLTGWRTLHKIATSRRDTARTRWPSEPGEEGLLRVQHAQQLLRELGPALVKSGLLRP